MQHEPITPGGRAYKLGYDGAVNNWPDRQVDNPYTRKDLARMWRRGFLAGTDAVLDRLRKEGKCIDV